MSQNLHLCLASSSRKRNSSSLRLPPELPKPPFNSNGDRSSLKKCLSPRPPLRKVSPKALEYSPSAHSSRWQKKLSAPPESSLSSRQPLCSLRPSPQALWAAQEQLTHHPLWLPAFFGCPRNGSFSLAPFFFFSFFLSSFYWFLKSPSESSTANPGVTHGCLRARHLAKN